MRNPKNGQRQKLMSLGPETMLFPRQHYLDRVRVMQVYFYIVTVIYVWCIFTPDFQSGANDSYISMGMLKWVETTKDLSLKTILMQSRRSAPASRGPWMGWNTGNALGDASLLSMTFRELSFLGMGYL